MLLTITCDGPHAKDFGHLIAKHPDSVFERELGFGRVTVFYPENAPQRASVALIVDVDPVNLVRRGHHAAALDHYVNDRPYVASSLTSVALRQAFASALAGKSKERPDLVTQPLPLRARISAAHVRGGAAMVHRLFHPLGYEVTTTPSLDPILGFEIAGDQTVHDLLSHLYVLLPVLDASKHYFVSDEEVEKLLAHGAGWLPCHPDRELIASRYLKFRRGLVREALSQLTADQPEEDENDPEEGLETATRLHDQRIAAVAAALKDTDPPVRRCVDMGCGEGRLLQALLADRDFTFEEIVGVDVSPGILAIAEKRLQLDRLPPAQRERVRLVQGSILYRDGRLEGCDALTLLEVIEHIDEERLDGVRKVLLAHLRPRRVIITTPNAEYNARFPAIPAGGLRHADHRFEWTRSQFAAWCEGAAAHGYRVHISGIGPSDPEVGSPTQMAIFDREATS